MKKFKEEERHNFKNTANINCALSIIETLAIKEIDHIIYEARLIRNAKFIKNGEKDLGSHTPEMLIKMEEDQQKAHNINPS